METTEISWNENRIVCSKLFVCLCVCVPVSLRALRQRLTSLIWGLFYRTCAAYNDLLKPQN